MFVENSHSDLRANFHAGLTAQRPAAANRDVGPPPTVFGHVMVAIIDANPALGTASRTALATGASLASSHKLTVLFLDEQAAGEDGAGGAGAGGGADKARERTADRAKRVRGQLSELGMDDVDVLEEEIEANSGQGSVAVGEAADSCGADLVVLSAAAVHDKRVDANLLAEFVPAPVLLVP